MVEDGDLVVLRLTGELDLASAYSLDDAIDAFRSPSHVVIDMRGVTFIDSTGLRCLLRANGLAERRGIELTIVRGPRQVAEVFRLSGLDKHLPLADEPPRN